MRSHPPTGDIIAVPAADPLNLVGIIVPGEKVPANSGHWAGFRDGVAVESSMDLNPHPAVRRVV